MLSTSSRAANAGLTLIELVVSIAIVAVIASLAAPSFSALIINAQIRTAAQALHDGLKLTRAEAIRRNERVTFLKGAGSSWTITVNSTGTVVQSHLSGEGSAAAVVSPTPGTGTTVSFNSLGRVVNPTAATTITQLDISVPTTVLPSSVTKNLRIAVTNGGAIRLCDPNATAGAGMGC
jgi:type IV fimbrial biogenesis protein FimT